MTNASANFAARLESLIGASHVAAGPSVCADYAVDAVLPSAVAKPASAEEVAAIVRFAALEKLAIVPCGNRTKLRIGMPPSRYDLALDMTGLSQIAHYDPGDLTLSVDAGFPIAKLNALLFEHKQFLPLLVPWYSRSTIGGTITSGVDSPLRQFYGTGRDFLLGAEFVDGAGKLCKSGGRVVKNVTGYDLHKLLIGSLGTLAVVTRLNFRTFPAPPASRGFVASFPSQEGALTLRSAIAESPLRPLTLDILSPGLAHVFATRTPATPEVAVFSDENRGAHQFSLPPVGDWFRPREWQLCAAFDGTPEVLERYARDLTRLSEQARATSTTILEDSTRPSVWGRLRESLSTLLEASPAAAVFKLSVLPGHHAALFSTLHKIAERSGLPHALVARSGGTLYFALLPVTADDDTVGCLAQASIQIFECASSIEGGAMLLFGPLPLKHAFYVPDASSGHHLNIWGPRRPDFALMRRLKSAFDPRNILAPSRLIEIPISSPATP